MIGEDALKALDFVDEELKVKEGIRGMDGDELNIYCTMALAESPLVQYIMADRWYKLSDSEKKKRIILQNMDFAEGTFVIHTPTYDYLREVLGDMDFVRFLDFSERRVARLIDVGTPPAIPPIVFFYHDTETALYKITGATFFSHDKEVEDLFEVLYSPNRTMEERKKKFYDLLGYSVEDALKFDKSR